MSEFRTGTIGIAEPGTPDEQLVVIVSGDVLNGITENPYVLTMDIVQDTQEAEPYVIPYRDNLSIETPTITARRKAAITLTDDRISFELKEILVRSLTRICLF